VAKVTVAFYNAYQGFLFQGESANDHALGSYAPRDHIAAVRAIAPSDDFVLCLAEVPFDSPTGESPLLDAHQLVSTVHHHYIKFPLERSWLPGIYTYGLAIAATFPVLSVDRYRVRAPSFNCTGPDGRPWTLHDKGALTITVLVAGRPLSVTCVHLFPAFHFGTSLESRAFREPLEALERRILATAAPEAIICGDFNNRDSQLRTILPNLFARGSFRNSISGPTLRGLPHQVDYILWRGTDLVCLGGELWPGKSDHSIVLARFELP